MAAPHKESLQYWHIVIDFDEDEKIQYAKELLTFDNESMWKKGFAPFVYILVLQEVYRNGYYVKWNDKLSMKVAKKTYSLQLDDIKYFIVSFLKAGLFSIEKMTKFNVITSESIQTRWKKVAIDCRRKLNQINPNFLVEGEVHPEEMSNTPSITQLMGGNNLVNYPETPKETDKYISSILSFNNSNNTNSKIKEKEIKIPKDGEETELMGGNNPVNEVVNGEETELMGGNNPVNEGVNGEETELMGGNNPVNEGNIREEAETYENALEKFNKLKGSTILNEHAKRIFFEHRDFEKGRMAVWGSLPKEGLTNEEVDEWLNIFGDKFNKWLDSQGLDNRSARQWGAHFTNWLPKQPKVREEVIQLEIVFPFDTESFKEAWKQWKIYLFTEKDDEYKSAHSENAALQLLGEISKGLESHAIAILKTAISSRWKNFYKSDRNGSALNGEPTLSEVAQMTPEEQRKRYDFNPADRAATRRTIK